MRNYLAGDITVGVSSPADLTGDAVWHLRPLLGGVTVDVSSPAVARDVTVGVASPAVAGAASLAEF